MDKVHLKEKRGRTIQMPDHTIFPFKIGNPDQNQVVTFNFKQIHRITLHITDRNDQA